MPALCFYFEVHQPFRLKRATHAEASQTHQYFDLEKNSTIFKKVAHKCYLPTNQVMLELIRKYQDKFKIAYSISGVAIEQMRQFEPEVLKSFQELAATGCVEFIDETYYHSLAAVYDSSEFELQVKKHRDLMKELFGVTPIVFRNTELIYSDEIGRLVSKLGYRAILAEGADDILGWRSPNFVYCVPGHDTRLLLKNYKLSDDIAFRFSNRGWEGWPLTSEKFANWVHSISGNGETVNLFMDYETFGEHQWADTGIFDFLRALPDAILCHSDWCFMTPTEVIKTFKPVAELNVSRLTSWADVNRDLSAWCGNKMQESALKQIYEISPKLREAGDSFVLDIWRKLQTSDHFYYMCTKWFADGDVHAYFSPYESPYDAFIAYMNALRDFKEFYPNENLTRVDTASLRLKKN